MDGVICIDKQAGMTSHDVVAQARRILNQRRVGHAGTLDPFATGLLVLLVGRATRLTQFLTGLEKEYEAIIRLGFATDTADRTGTPISEVATRQEWTAVQIEEALASLRGEIDQVPPMYSAKKQGGRKLYELARKGTEVDRAPVRVSIHEFEPLKPKGQWLKDNLDGTVDFEVRVVCSSGTYIRTLAEDFGKQLNTGAHLAELRRTRVGDFTIGEALTLVQLKTRAAEEALGKALYKPDDALTRLPAIDVNDEDVRRIKHGMKLQVSDTKWANGERVRIRDAAGNLIAVATFDSETAMLHPSVVLTVED
ncbi:MAG TPA: tRNA pseudouridine(55) synthase TruB [Pyrinomonadaceae bacterium]